MPVLLASQLSSQPLWRSILQDASLSCLRCVAFCASALGYMVRCVGVSKSYFLVGPTRLREKSVQAHLLPRLPGRHIGI